MTTPTQMHRVACYLRVSTDQQSVGMQLDTLRQYCANRGWSIYREYCDEGVSGKKASRPGLDQLMSDARKRKFDCCLVWAFDRFARSTKHLLMALEEFNSVGIQFISYQQNIDTTGPFGEFFFTVVAAFGQLEHAMIVERVRCGLAHARANGKMLGRPRRIVNGDEMARLRQEGASFRDIAKAVGASPGTVRTRLQAAEYVAQQPESERNSAQISSINQALKTEECIPQISAVNQALTEAQ